MTGSKTLWCCHKDSSQMHRPEHRRSWGSVRCAKSPQVIWSGIQTEHNRRLTLLHSNQASAGGAAHPRTGWKSSLVLSTWASSLAAVICIRARCSPSLTLSLHCSWPPLAGQQQLPSVLGPCPQLAQLCHHIVLSGWVTSSAQMQGGEAG